jgi:8-oxo-dGTP pyrophosphatase MutT (NUDIX family)
MSKQIVEYVVGFLFAPTREQPDQVALIMKNKPAWQKDKLNGLGGHIERNESPLIAMRREFEEEGGADIIDWEHFATIMYSNPPNVDHPVETMAKVWYFRSFRQTTLISKTREKVEWYDWKKILGGYDNAYVKSLEFLIPLALELHPINVQIRDGGKSE